MVRGDAMVGKVVARRVPRVAMGGTGVGRVPGYHGGRVLYLGPAWLQYCTRPGWLCVPCPGLALCTLAGLALPDTVWPRPGSSWHCLACLVLYGLFGTRYGPCLALSGPVWYRSWPVWPV